jgi:hypothetical protein
MRKEFIGRWRITEMEQWDQDFVDMDGPGVFEFKKDGTGEFQFGCVHGYMDWRTEEVGGRHRVGFSWDGNDECDPAFGRGWAEVDGNLLSGQIYFHQGDQSLFTAERVAAPSAKRRRKR